LLDSAKTEVSRARVVQHVITLVSKCRQGSCMFDAHMLGMFVSEAVASPKI